MFRIFIYVVLAFCILSEAHGGFIYGSPCSSANTLYINDTHGKQQWPRTVNCIDIRQLGTQVLEKKMSLLTTVHTLYADEMNLKTIPSNIIAVLPYLDLMDFSRNKITHMVPNVFQRNPYLRKLILADNRIRIIKGKPLLRHRNITDLVLSRNKIKSLPYYTFRRLPSLKILFLDHNRLEELNPKLFANLHELVFLNVEHNPLKVVPYAVQLPQNIVAFKYTIRNSSALHSIELMD